MSLEAQTVTVTELAALNLSNRFTRTCDALEKIAATGDRIATSLEQVVALFACVTEMVEPEEPGRVTRGTIRTHNMPPGLLSMRSGGEAENDE
jgi:hypothetical protein